MLIDFETSDRQKANELRTDHFDKVRGKNREIKFRGRLGREVKPFVTFTVVEVSRALTARRFNCLCVLAQIETFILFLLFSPIYIYTRNDRVAKNSKIDLFSSRNFARYSTNIVSIVVEIFFNSLGPRLIFEATRKVPPESRIGQNAIVTSWNTVCTRHLCHFTAVVHLEVLLRASFESEVLASFDSCCFALLSF